MASQTGIPGMSGFANPLDIVEDPQNGNLYVTEHGAGRITLMRPIASSTTGRLTLENLDGVPFPDRLAFSRIGSVTTPPANGVHDRATLRLRNTWDRPPQPYRPADLGAVAAGRARPRFRSQLLPALPLTSSCGSLRRRGA